MLIKRLLYLVVFLAFLLASGCTIYFGKETFHTHESLAQTNHQFSYHFVLIPEEVDNEYWRLIEEGAREAATIYNVNLEYLGPKQADSDELLKTIDVAIAGKIDGILTQGMKDQEFISLLNKAVGKGIPVVTVDTDTPNSERTSYIGTDNYYAGFLAGKALIADTTGEQKVAIITGRFAAANQKLRVQGFMDAVEREKRIEIVDVQESNITKIGAVKTTHQLLMKHPEVTAFYGTSALDGIGIAQVVESKNINNLYILAFDTLPETLKLMEKGIIDATVVQYPKQMGYKAVEALFELKQGKEREEIKHTDTTVIHKQDLPFTQATFIGGRRP